MPKSKVERDGIDAASLGSTVIGFPQEHLEGGSVTVERVTIQENSGNAGFWNIEVDGNNIFSSEQSLGVSGSAQVYYPDQRANRTSSANPLAIELDVSTQESGSQTYDVSVGYSYS